MKLIGMFYSNKEDMIEAYRAHSQTANNSSRDYCSVTVNPTKMIITTDDFKYRYYSFPNDEFINDIAGLEFDAIFSEVTDPHAKWYIQTRFRPGFN